MGRVSHARLRRRKKARVTIEVRPLHDAVFPGSGRGIAGAGAEKIRARRRDRRSLRRRLFLRRAVAARPSGGEPGAQACGGDAGHIHRLRSSRRCRRTATLPAKFWRNGGARWKHFSGAMAAGRNSSGCRRRRRGSATPRRGSSALAPRSTVLSLSGAILLIAPAIAPACRRSRITAVLIVWSAAFAPTRIRRWSARCCSGCTTGRACCITSASASSIKREDKPALTKKLKALIAPPGFTGNAPGGPSRWSTERSGEWQPLKPKLVVEVCYDHFSGERFRHGTRLLRWRPDKSPRQCTLDQVKQKKANLLALLG